MPKTTEAPSIGKKNAKWLDETEGLFQQIADLPKETQIACFRHREDSGESTEDMLANCIEERGKLTQEHVSAAFGRVRDTVSEFQDGIFAHVPAAMLSKPLRKRDAWMGYLLNSAFVDLLWRIPIQEARNYAGDLLRDRIVVAVCDYRATSESWALPKEDFPHRRFALDERLVWVTEAACEEISHAVASSTTPTLSADMFPVPAATVVFHVPSRMGPTTSIGVFRWMLGEYEGSDVVWVESTAPLMHTGLPVKRAACIPLGHKCEEFEDRLFVDNTDRLLWAVLQIAQTPLAHRPKLERSAIRRSDKRAMTRGFIDVGDLMHVIDLRRPHPGDAVPGSERHVHAHWVQGHTRQHWWPSLEQHVPTWIQTHVRGNHELGWAPGHTPDGPPRKQVVWRVKGDADQSPQRNSRSATKRRGRKVGAR